MVSQLSNADYKFFVESIKSLKDEHASRLQGARLTSRDENKSRSNLSDLEEACDKALTKILTHPLLPCRPVGYGPIPTKAVPAYRALYEAFEGRLKKGGNGTPSDDVQIDRLLREYLRLSTLVLEDMIAREEKSRGEVAVEEGMPVTHAGGSEGLLAQAGEGNKLELQTGETEDRDAMDTEDDTRFVDP